MPGYQPAVMITGSSWFGMYQQTVSFLVFRWSRWVCFFQRTWWLAISDSEYDQEIPQLHTADKPVASLGRATQQSRDAGKTYKAFSNQLSRPHRDDCKNSMDTK